MRRKMKGLLIVGAVVLFIVAMAGNVFAWDLSEAAKPYRGRTIRVSAMAGYEWNELTAKIAPIFEAITGIKVTFDFVPYGEVVAKHLTEFASGTNVHDLYDVDTPYLALHAPFGVPLEELMKDTKLYDPGVRMDDFYPGVIHGMKYEDRLYGFPQMYCFAAVFYRTDLFEKYGISRAPVTIDEYYQTAKKLTRDGVYGMTLSGSRTGIGDEVYTLFWGAGASIFDDYMRPTFKKGGRYYDEMVHVLRYYQKIYVEGLAPPGSTDYEIGEALGVFAEGLTAMSWNWSIVGAQLNDPTRSPKVFGKWNAALIPRDNPKVKQWHRQGAKGYMINSLSPKPVQEAAYLFTQWNSNPLMSYVLAKMGDSTPFRKSILEDPALRDSFPHWSVHREVFGQGYDILVPYIPDWAECEDIMAIPFQAVMVGRITPEEAADWAARDLEEMLAAKGYYREGKEYRNPDGTYPVWLTGNYWEHQ